MDLFCCSRAPAQIWRPHGRALQVFSVALNINGSAKSGFKNVRHLWSPELAACQYFSGVHLHASWNRLMDIK